jgi:hypothetical protein
VVVTVAKFQHRPLSPSAKATNWQARRRQDWAGV